MAFSASRNCLQMPAHHGKGIENCQRVFKALQLIKVTHSITATTQVHAAATPQLRCCIFRPCSSCWRPSSLPAPSAILCKLSNSPTRKLPGPAAPAAPSSAANLRAGKQHHRTRYLIFNAGEIGLAGKGTQLTRHATIAPQDLITVRCQMPVLRQQHSGEQHLPSSKVKSAYRGAGVQASNNHP
jgi:hypothetical protein